MPERSCTPEETLQRLKSPELLALIDVREQQEFCRNHVLRASNAPLSHLEFLIPPLVPSRNVPVILMDGGDAEDTHALRAAGCLHEMGYKNVQLLDGGLSGWMRAGYVAVDGTSCMTKGYAECLEREMKTPGLTPDEVHRRVAAGEPIVLVDIRVPEEYESMAIPGGILAPGCESAYRFLDLVPSPDALVVTNCGSRTRGILCAQMLRDFGVPNSVATMRGGTLNWKLSGYELEFGRTDRTAPPSAEAMRFAREHADALARRHGVSFIDADTLRAWRAEADEHPLYVFDVRQPEEYAAGHLAGSRCAPGCQLAQLSDDFAAVRNARFVLVDDTEVRAVITAYWLKHMAVPDVHVLRGGLGASGLGRTRLESGVEPAIPAARASKAGIDVGELAAALAEPKPPLVVNVGASPIHRQGHIPGAAWVPRSRLERVRDRFPDAARVVLTSDTEQHARLAASDAAELWPQADVRFLKGGTPAWINRDLALETGMPLSFSAEDDVWYLTYKDPHATREDMEAFFDWNLELADKIIKDGTYAFRYPHPVS